MIEEYDVFAELNSFSKKSNQIATKTPVLDILEDNDISNEEECVILADSPVKKAMTNRRKAGRKAQKTTREQITELLQEPTTVKKKSPTKPRKASGRRKKKAATSRMETIVNNLGTIDLVSSSIIPVTGVISIDSEDDEEKLKPSADLETSFDLDNPELSIKINWGGNIEIFKLRKHQKFGHIFKMVAEREKAKLENLVFNIESKIVGPDDSPDSINYKIFQFICGRVVVSEKNEIDNKIYRKKDPNQISLKIQSDRWKRPFLIKINRSDTFKILNIKLSEEIKMSCDCFNLHFDGELLQLMETPNDLELDGGEIIDCVFKK